MNRAAQIEAARREVERARKAWDATQTVPLALFDPHREGACCEALERAERALANLEAA